MTHDFVHNMEFESQVTCLAFCFVNEYLMWTGFSVHEMLRVHPFHVLILLQVSAHLHMLRVGLEVCVCCSSGLVQLLQLERKRKREKEKEKEKENVM